MNKPETKAMSKEYLSKLIENHLGFEGKTDDKSYLQASVKYYMESGKVSGSFYSAVQKIIEECHTNYVSVDSQFVTNLKDLLCNVSQLIQGWNATESEWSEWDKSVHDGVCKCFKELCTKQNEQVNSEDQLSPEDVLDMHISKNVSYAVDGKRLDSVYFIKNSMPNLYLACILAIKEYAAICVLDDKTNEALEFAKWLVKNQWRPFSDTHWERWDDEIESIERLLLIFRAEREELQKQKEDNA